MMSSTDTEQSNLAAPVDGDPSGNGSTEVAPPDTAPQSANPKEDATIDESGQSEGTIPEDFDLKIEAALMSSDRPQPPAKLAQLVGPTNTKAVTAAVARLNATYAETGRSFRIEPLAGGLQIITLPEYGHILSEMHRSRVQSRLSPAALETLAIVAYKQPILRADVEAIRGVASGEVLRSLMERRLVKIVGRAEVIGRPILYGTTKSFLQIFGLRNLKDMPKVEELQAPPKTKAEPSHKVTAETSSTKESDPNPSSDATSAQSAPTLTEPA